MADIEKIIQTIYSVVDEINPTLPPEMQLTKSPDTVLFGQSGRLDSLGLVNFIVATEAKVADQFNLNITIADERAMSQKHSPFRTIKTLAEYVLMLMKESQNG